jgi:hypothetical protein
MPEPHLDGSILCQMADELPLLTIEDLQRMSLAERVAAVEERIVTDVEELPLIVRRRIEQTGQQLTAQRLARGVPGSE